MASAPTIDLDPRDTLAGLELVVRRRRAVEIDDLQLVGHWCDLQSTDPARRPPPGPHGPAAAGLGPAGAARRRGHPEGPRADPVRAGIARGVHVLSARAVAADVLDLRHRLPRSWAVFLAGGADAWLVRRVAVADPRPVPGRGRGGRHRRRGRDRRARPRAGCCGIVEAKIIEADPAAHEAKVEAEKRRRFVSLTRTDETGLRHVIARVTAGDAAYVDAVVNRVADILAGRPEHADAPRDLLRSLAFGWLARPAELLKLLLEHTDPDRRPDARPTPSPTPSPRRTRTRVSSRRSSAGAGLPRRPARRPAPINPDRLRPRAVLYVHLHEAALTGTGSTDGTPAAGVARVEGLGPHSLTQLTELLGHTRVAVQPVIDLRDRVSVNRYEHPTRIKERIHLRHPGDVFPHASRVSRKVDLDHRIAYRPTVRPGRPAPATANPSAAPDTAPRPTSATSPPRSPTAPSSGARRTDSTDSSTSTAPTPSTRTRPTPSPDRPRAARPGPPHHPPPRPTDLNAVASAPSPRVAVSRSDSPTTDRLERESSRRTAPASPARSVPHTIQASRRARSAPPRD